MIPILEWLRRNGYATLPEKFYQSIDGWNRWYVGYVGSFHRYRQYNGRRHITRYRQSLGMAKTVCEDWADLALNEKVAVTLESPEDTAAVWDVLNANGFMVNGNQLIEKTFALGTGAFVERLDGERVKIDYVPAQMIFPISWENGEITECAFASEAADGKNVFVRLSIHQRDERGNYRIENHSFVRNGWSVREIELPDGVEPVHETGGAVPWFQIIKPNIVNNTVREQMDNPMGISVFANAIDQLKGCDLVYDSYCNEFSLGKKRITVPLSMARMELEKDGAVQPVFDDNDVVFSAVPVLDGVTNGITEHNMELRYEAHDAGMQMMLNLLSVKCGMGKDRYRFEDGQTKTATEVISEKSELYQTLRKHELLLEAALTGLVRAICSMLGRNAEQEISLSFDDSIIQDTAAQREIDRQDVREGLLSKWEYRVRWMGEDETTAKAAVAAMGGDEPLGFNL